MRKQYFTIFILGMLALFSLSGCEEKQTQPETPTLILNTEYTVGIKTTDMETKGKLMLDDNKQLRFIHEDPNKIFFGMEEQITNHSLCVKFKDITWENDEVVTRMAQIQKILLHICETKPDHYTSDSIRGIEAVKESYPFHESTIFLWIDKNTDKPLKIQAEIDHIFYELNFSDSKA